MRRRNVVVWMAHHDNGWTTTVRENVDGTFSAAAEAPDETMVADYVEGSPEIGKAAAEYALKRKSGHVCSPRWSPWSSHSHVVLVSE
jgi:isocitrate/isopropylmalate dehydrogenase